jgi:hypothetical protein
VKIETVLLLISVTREIVIQKQELVSKIPYPVMMELIVLKIAVIQLLVVHILPTMTVAYPMMCAK